MTELFFEVTAIFYLALIITVHISPFAAIPAAALLYVVAKS